MLVYACGGRSGVERAAEARKDCFLKANLRYINVEPIFKLRWCRARDLFGSQTPLTTGGFEL